MCPTYAWKGRFTILEVTRTLEWTPPNFVTLITLYENIVKLLHVLWWLILGPPGVHLEGWKSWTTAENPFHGCFGMFSQPDIVDGNAGCEENALISSICIFAILTTLNGNMRRFSHVFCGWTPRARMPLRMTLEIENSLSRCQETNSWLYLAGKLPQDADTGIVSNLEIICDIDYVIRHLVGLLYMCLATNMEMLKPGIDTQVNLTRGKELLPWIHVKLLYAYCTLCSNSRAHVHMTS